MNFLLNPLNLCELWHSEHSEHSDSPTATFPPTSVRFPTHKKISEIRGIRVSLWSKPAESFREIFHPQKNQ